MAQRWLVPPGTYGRPLQVRIPGRVGSGAWTVEEARIGRRQARAGSETPRRRRAHEDATSRRTTERERTEDNETEQRRDEGVLCGCQL